jgi:hypothetical protein
MSTTELPTLEPDESSNQRPTVSPALRILLAALLAGAGTIHLAMIAPHAQDYVAEGVIFALAGWAQVTLAFFVFTHPSRRVLTTTVAVSLLFIAAWALSRTVGLPYGAHAGEAEAVTSVDLAAAGFQALTVVGAVVAMVAPRLGAGIGRSGLVVGAGLPLLAVMALTTATLTSSDGVHTHGDSDHDHVATAAGHDHGEGDGDGGDDGHDHGPFDLAAACADHDHLANPRTMDEAQQAAWEVEHRFCGDMAPEPVTWDDRCDAEFNIASYWHEADAVGVNDHAHGHDDDDDHDGHDGMGEAESARVVTELAAMTDDEYEEWLREFGAAERDPDAPDDTGAGGHIGPQPWHPLTDPDDCAQLAAELELAASVAERYPTAAEAMEDGYVLVAPYLPGIASHFMNFSLVDDVFEVDRPEMLLFDGNTPESQVVGLSYYIRHDGDSEPTQGFTGRNDHYHRHVGLCIRGGVVIGDTDTTEEQCEAMGGRKASGADGWMSHAWVVPGCESPWGVFSAANPVLDRTLVDNSGQGDPCSGSEVVSRYDFTPGPPEQSTTASGGDQDG